MRTRALSQIGVLSSHVRWLVGSRWKWIAVIPILNVGAAASEVVLLVCLVNSLLLLVDSSSPASIGAAFGEIEVTSGQLLWIGVAASLVSIALRVAESVLVGRLAARAGASARRRVVQSYFGADWWSMTELRAGRLQQLLGLNIQFASSAVPLLGTMLASLVNLAVYGSFIVLASPAIGGLFAVMGGGLVAAFTLLRRRTRVAAREVQEKTRDVQLAATTLVALNRELHVFDVRVPAQANILGLNEEVRGALARLRTMQRIIPVLFQQLLLLAVLGMVALAYRFAIDPSSFGAAAILAIRTLTYLQQLNASSQAYVEMDPYLAELRAAVDEFSQNARLRGSQRIESVETLTLAGVGFSYDGTLALENVNLSVRRGERIGVVGPSGGGKTTLINILAGLLEPQMGTYEVNGEIATEVSSSEWARNFALLAQDPLLVRGTVAENVAFFRARDDESILRAAVGASVATDIRDLDQGWETSVGDGNASLSGGQRQRLGLARALYGRPSVLLLDEPTSALDVRNEALIEEALLAIRDEMIVVVVSHRPALVRQCDRVLIIENGLVVAVEPPDSLRVRQFTGV